MIDAISNDLTPFGSSIVAHQLLLSRKYVYSENPVDDEEGEETSVVTLTLQVLQVNQLHMTIKSLSLFSLDMYAIFLIITIIVVTSTIIVIVNIIIFSLQSYIQKIDDQWWMEHLTAF